jgi:hypothetical protein
MIKRQKRASKSHETVPFSKIQQPIFTFWLLATGPIKITEAALDDTEAVQIIDYCELVVCDAFNGSYLIRRTNFCFFKGKFNYLFSPSGFLLLVPSKSLKLLWITLKLYI